jgi:hypothetical protein
MGERRSTLVRLEPGEAAQCNSPKCRAWASFKVTTPKSGPGSKGGVVITRYLCHGCIDKFMAHNPKTIVATTPVAGDK